MEEDISFEELEQVVREGEFYNITKYISKLTKTIDWAKDKSKNLKKNDFNLPNTSITIKDSLTRLSQEFEKYGLSIWVEYRKDGHGVDVPFVGNAVIEDLRNKFNKSRNLLSDFTIKLYEINDQRANQLIKYDKENFIVKLFRRFKQFFVKDYQIDMTLTSEENNELNQLISEYNKIDDSINNYNLRDNLVDSLTEVIVDRGYSVDDIPDIIDVEIAPDLEKMQLLDLVPKLQETIDERHKEKMQKDKNAIKENESFLDSVKVEDYDDKAIIYKHNNSETMEKNSSEPER